MDAVEVPTEPIAVTIPQAARLLNCTISALRHLIWRGDLPFIKLGKKFVIRVVDLHKYAERAVVRL